MAFEKGDAEKIRWVAGQMSVTGILRQTAIHMGRIADEIESLQDQPEKKCSVCEGKEWDGVK